MSVTFAPVLFQLGIGWIAGFFIGYAIRKVIKVALILGIVVFSLMFLAYTNVIDIDYGGLVEIVSKFISTVNPGTKSAHASLDPFALRGQPYHWSYHWVQEEMIVTSCLLHSDRKW